MSGNAGAVSGGIAAQRARAPVSRPGTSRVWVDRHGPPGLPVSVAPRPYRLTALHRTSAGKAAEPNSSAQELCAPRRLQSRVHFFVHVRIGKPRDRAPSPLASRDRRRDLNSSSAARAHTGVGAPAPWLRSPRRSFREAEVQRWSRRGPRDLRVRGGSTTSSRSSRNLSYSHPTATRTRIAASSFRPIELAAV